MGKFKFIFLLLLALVLVCGIVMVVDAPNSFDDSVSLIPVSNSSADLDESNCVNDTCVPDFNSTDKSSSASKGNNGEIDYDSKYYDGSYIEGLHFCNDFEQAFKDAKAHHRNVMIIFDGEACIYCEYLKDESLTDSEIQKEINDKDILLMTYTSESPELAEQLNIHGTPTTVIFDENGNELGRIVGYENTHQYLTELKDYNSR